MGGSGGFDAQGIFGSVGDLGRAIAGERERQYDRAYRAAQMAYEAVAHLPDDDPQKQLALRRLEDTGRRAFGEEFRLGRRIVGARPAVPAQRVTVPRTPVGVLEALQPGTEQPTEEVELPGQPAEPGRELIVPPGGPDRRPISFRQYARIAGLTLSPDEDAELGDRPATEVIDLFPDRYQKQGAKQALAALQNLIDGYSDAIYKAPTPEGRQIAVENAKRNTAIFLSQYPHLADAIPDWDALARRVADEESEFAKRASAVATEKQWRTGYDSARKSFVAALRIRTAAGINEVVQAVTDLNQFTRIGRQKGFLPADAPGLGLQAQLQRWFVTLPPSEAFLLLSHPLIRQYGIRPSPEQAKEIKRIVAVREADLAGKQRRAKGGGKKKKGGFGQPLL